MILNKKNLQIFIKIKKIELNLTTKSMRIFKKGVLKYQKMIFTTNIKTKQNMIQIIIVYEI